MTTTPEQISSESWQEVVSHKVSAIRFGSVQITVHEGRVTQVESLEKTRFLSDKAGAGGTAALQAKKP